MFTYISFHIKKIFKLYFSLRKNPGKRYKACEALRDSFILQDDNQLHNNWDQLKELERVFNQRESSLSLLNYNIFLTILPCDWGMKYVPDCLMQRMNDIFQEMDLDASGYVILLYKI